MSRGQWAALGSTLTLMSCNDASPALVDASLDAPSFDTVDGAKPDISIGADAVDDARGPASEGGLLDGALDAMGDVHDATEPREDVRTADARGDGKADIADPADAGAPDADHDDGTDGTEHDGAMVDASDAGTSPDADIDAPLDATDEHRFVCSWGACSGPSCNTCDQRTEYCSIISAPSAACSVFPTTDAGSVNASCPLVATCLCVVEAGMTWLPGCACTDDGGGVLVYCNGCYGSPPARWERLANDA
jgi:hypothetical protein